MFLLLFIGCDNPSEPDITLEIATFSSALNNSWTYRFTEDIYTLSRSHDVVRTIIDPSLIPFNYNNECNEVNDINYIYSEGINFSDNFDGEGLQIECDDAPTGYCQLTIDTYNYISYSAYVNNSANFQFCSAIYDTQDSNNPEQTYSNFIYNLGSNPYSIFNIIDIDFPLYIGKTWASDNFTYEVLSSEVLVLNIQNETVSYDTYKIGIFNESISEMNLYISSIGILKIVMEKT